VGTDTKFGRPGFLPAGPDQAPVGRSRLPGRPDVGTDTKFQIWGQTRCPVYRSGTLNVQRSTLNFQLGDRKGAWWAEYGDRHDVWAVGGANRGTDTVFGPGRQTLDTPDLTKRRSGGRGCRGARMWGQTRCPVYRSGTLNVQRSTLNFQRGDRKGAWWAGYGDRHEIWTTGRWTRWT